jgi:DNA-binding MarR family transcriptional regulator
MAEATALLRPREHIVRALTKELLIRRSMTGIPVDEIIAAAVAAKSADDECKRRRRLGTTPIIHRAFRAVSTRSS